MSLKSTVFAALATTVFALPALAADDVMAGDLMIHDPYARVSAKMSKSGAAFMMIHNKGSEADHLISVASPVAERVELHTHKEDSNGVMKMLHVEEGFDVPADGQLAMERGGHHVMFLGLKQELKQGDMVPVTLVFEKAGEVQVNVPVDLERKPGMGMKHGDMDHGEHGKMDHGKMDHGKMKKAD